MNEKREIVHICAHCGNTEIETKKLLHHSFLTSRFPDGWSILGEEYLCPKCALKYIVNSERKRREK